MCIFGEVNPHVYSNARKLKEEGVIFLGNMLSEVAYIKLMFALKFSKNKERVIEYMLTNLKHELSDNLNISFI